MSTDGYVIQEATGEGWSPFAFYGTDEPSAVLNCRWYNRRTQGRRAFRVVLQAGESRAVVYA